jgi:hypothetical protein
MPCEAFNDFDAGSYGILSVLRRWSWPSHDIYPSLEAWRERIMLRQHADS